MTESDDARAAFTDFAPRRDSAPTPRDPRQRRRALVAITLAAIGLGVLVAVVLHQKSERDQRAAIALRQAVRAERARLRRIQAPHEGSARGLLPPAGAGTAAQLAARASLVRHVEAAITRDARARDRAGELDGPITHTECGPIERRPDAIPDDRVISKQVGRYDCVAVKADVRKDGRSVARLGHAFVTALHFRDFSYVWCRNTPPQSERGEVLVSVRLARRCLAATGAAIGTGYYSEP